MNTVSSGTLRRVIFRVAVAALSRRRSFRFRTTAAAAAAGPEVIALPKFVITETPVNPYQSQQALSATRVAMSIQDVPQTLSVVPSEFIADSMSLRMLDAAKYVTPVVESTLPFGGDRYMIRGFQVSQEFIDGSVISGGSGYSMSIPQFNIERIEVIKGPNAILVPGGSPGGVMNPITKAPIERECGFGHPRSGRIQRQRRELRYQPRAQRQESHGRPSRRQLWRNNNMYIKNMFRNRLRIFAVILRRALADPEADPQGRFPAKP